MLEEERMARRVAIAFNGGNAVVPGLVTADGVEMRARVEACKRVAIRAIEKAGREVNCPLRCHDFSVWSLLDEAGAPTGYILPYCPANPDRLRSAGFVETTRLRPALPMILAVESGPKYLHVRDVIDHERYWMR